MAVFNEILAGRFNRLLQKLLGMKGGPPSPSLAGDIMPVIPFPLSPTEAYLLNSFLFGASITQGAVVGQVGRFRIRNPSTSGVVGLIMQLLVSSDVATSAVLSLGASAVDLGNTVARGRFDARTQRAGSSLVVTSDTNAASAALTQIARAFFGGGTTFSFLSSSLQAIPLLPGDALHMESPNTNVALVSSVWWSERPLEESELA